MSRHIKRAKEKALGLLKKGADKANELKVAVVAGSSAVVATVSQAAVTVDSATGEIAGTLDMGPYYSALSIVIPVTVTLLVGGIILRTIKKA
jgi:ABC-type molybdate transport system permease subunit